MALADVHAACDKPILKIHVSSKTECSDSPAKCKFSTDGNGVKFSINGKAIEFAPISHRSLSQLSLKAEVERGYMVITRNRTMTGQKIQSNIIIGDSRGIVIFYDALLLSISEERDLKDKFHLIIKETNALVRRNLDLESLVDRILKTIESHKPNCTGAVAIYERPPLSLIAKERDENGSLIADLLESPKIILNEDDPLPTNLCKWRKHARFDFEHEQVVVAEHIEGPVNVHMDPMATLTDGFSRVSCHCSFLIKGITTVHGSSQGLGRYFVFSPSEQAPNSIDFVPVQKPFVTLNPSRPCVFTFMWIDDPIIPLTMDHIIQLGTKMTCDTNPAEMQTELFALAATAPTLPFVLVKYTIKRCSELGDDISAQFEDDAKVMATFNPSSVVGAREPISLPKAKNRQADTDHYIDHDTLNEYFELQHEEKMAADSCFPLNLSFGEYSANSAKE